MNEPIQEKAPEAARPFAEARPVVADSGPRGLDGCHHVAHQPEKAADPGEIECPGRPGTRTACRSTKPKSRNCKAASQELQRQELVAQNALAQQTRLLGGAPASSQPNQASETTGNAPTERSEDPIQAERKKRDYLSLFASNIALSYRKNAAAPEADAAAPEPQSPSSANPAPPPSGLDATPTRSTSERHAAASACATPSRLSTTGVAPSVPARSSSSASPTEADHDTKEVTKPAATSPGAPNVAAGKTYIVFEGTILEAVLINRLDGSFAGPVECLLSDDIYSHDRQHLLIPAGTKILGEAKKVEALGQTRLAVAFHRLIMPDGYSVSLDQFKGLDQIGDTGLRDKVNNHYLRIFGTSLAIGALGAVAETGTGSVFTDSGSDLMRQQFASSMAQSSEQILDRFLNILPTVTIREGHRVKVYLSGDLPLPDYNNHKMPSDL